jgi:GSCFA family
MSEHPYRSQSDRAFWSRAVAHDYNPFDVHSIPWPIMRYTDRIVSAGSCFAANVVPWLDSGGFGYVRTEVPHPAVAYLPENLGYRQFSAAYGNIYTARQLRQLLDRSCGLFRPVEDRWYADGKVIDPYRPGLRHPATSDREFDLLTQQHLDATHDAFAQATTVFFTLGLTEAWESAADGAVFPACPGTIAGTFDPERHLFHNFTAAEVTADLVAFADRLKRVGPGARLILTVSPVPLVATATDQHVLAATTYSKAVLRVAAEAASELREDIFYFPAYEIVAGPQAPKEFYAEDRREVTEAGIAAVMNSVMYSSAARPVSPPQPARVDPASAPRPAAETAQSKLSRRITEAECDEALADD